MIARLLIGPLDTRKKEISQHLSLHLKDVSTNNHPDLLYFLSDSKLGIAEARKIKEHFSLKPYSARGRAVVLEDATSLTPEAQNALLKILEELPEHGIFILAADAESKLLPTVISRCQIDRLQGTGDRGQLENYQDEIEKLLNANIEDRFEYIEKLKDREGFFHSLLDYFHKKLPLYSDFSKELLTAEEWANQNVNIRGILEYLMLKIPKSKL